MVLLDFNKESETSVNAGSGPIGSELRQERS